jgi:hypothetical protein
MIKYKEYLNLTREEKDKITPKEFVEMIKATPNKELIAEMDRISEEDKKLTEDELAMKYGVGEEDL